MDQAKADTAATRRLTAELWAVLSQYRWRIVVAVVLLIIAKLATVAVPLVLKEIIDTFSAASLPVRLPFYLLIGYAALRFASTLFSELRDLLFARVTLSTVSAYAQKTFAHLHALDARFHGKRQIGELLPNIDRGTSGIAFLLGVALFTIVPTFVEIGMVLVIMLGRYTVHERSLRFTPAFAFDPGRVYKVAFDTMPLRPAGAVATGLSVNLTLAEEM